MWRDASHQKLRNKSGFMRTISIDWKSLWSKVRIKLQFIQMI